jgi:hypothetical protein
MVFIVVDSFTMRTFARRIYAEQARRHKDNGPPKAPLSLGLLQPARYAALCGDVSTKTSPQKRLKTMYIVYEPRHFIHKNTVIRPPEQNHPVLISIYTNIQHSSASENDLIRAVAYANVV